MNEITPIAVEHQAGSTFDLTQYLSLFDDDEISEADKLALLDALWSIIQSLVHLGWGVHPAQQAQAARAIREIACGKVGGLPVDCGTSQAAMVEFQDQFLIEHFDSAAGQSPQEEKES
ncbi:hypothetical protein SAMN05518801_104249 [Novosphingobium sp. CF614]|uniref:hypothetical protein n=1 Tax=Novosphingobium sp. CF614 TaxID=1884364 RepID=UPI0008EDB53E|nr:hypothetical protein [Novosphingobium sp. CF614]SFF97072.1 hypothetical protein SAMN05518801_104249 [Novosphingobium sp. CF614]